MIEFGPSSARVSLRSLSGTRDWIPGLGLLIPLLAIGAIGFLIFKHHVTETEYAARDALNAIAELKMMQVDQWLNTQHGVAEAIMRDNLLAVEVENWFSQGAPDNQGARNIQARLVGLSRVDSYEDIMLLDDKSNLRLQVAGAAHPDAQDIKLALQAMGENQVVRSDIHWSGDGKPEMDLVAPLVIQDESGSRVIGAVYIHIDPGVFLWPHIQTWPTASPSGETVLVRRDGNDVLFLNELRHQKDTTLKLRIPLDESMLPAAMALRGEGRVMEGLDYRGVPVIATARTISNTDWVLVAKLDRNEVNAPLRSLAATGSGLLVLFTLLAGIIVFLWQRKLRAQSRALLASETLERLRLEKRFEITSKMASDIILLADETGRLVDCNDAALRAYGYTRDELLLLNVNDLRAQQSIAAFPGDLAEAADKNGVTVEIEHRRRDGSTLQVESKIQRIEIQGQWFYQGVNRDITERKLAEAALQDSEARLAEAQAIGHMGSFDWNIQDGTIRWSDEVYRIFGLRPQSIAPSYKTLTDATHPDDRQLAQTAIDQALRDHEPYSIDHRLCLQDGSVRYVHRQGEVQLDDNHQPLRIIGTLQDITERKQTEETLADSRERYRMVAEAASNAIAVITQDGRIDFINNASKTLFGYSPSEIVGSPFARLLPPALRARFVQALEVYTKTGKRTMNWSSFETLGLHKSGKEFPVEVSIGEYTRAGKYIFTVILRDITERKQAAQAAQALHVARSRLAHLVVSSPTVIYSMQPSSDHSITFVSSNISTRFGYLAGDFTEKQGFWAELIHPGDLQRVLAETTRLLESGQLDREYRIRHKDDGYRWVRDESRVIRDEAGTPVEIVGSWFDITERKQAEEALRESEEQFRGLVEQSIVGIVVLDSDRFHYVNPQMAEIFGYAQEELAGQPVTMIVAEKDYRRFTRAVRSNRLRNNVQTQFSFTGIRKDGSTITVGASAKPSTIEGRPVIIGLLRDISQSERDRLQIERQVIQLEQTMLGTVQAVSTLVELRDPYTAGHEKRVGQLAREIGTELGLTEDACRGLEIMGAVHDIGKIAVPAEILTRPGRLTAAEFELIKAHPQLGYDVVKDITFPWPVAVAILQHHERMDGSGYPKGLTGNEIILEARILAVADVVEAMASHRPYRATRGIDAALEEISSFQGVRYDTEVVDACLRLFGEKEYRLPEQ